MQLAPTTGFSTELVSLFFLFITHEPIDVVSYLEVKQQPGFTAASAESGKGRGAVATAVRLWKNHQGFLLFRLVLIVVHVLMVLFTPEELPASLLKGSCARTIGSGRRGNSVFRLCPYFVASAWALRAIVNQSHTSVL